MLFQKYICFLGLLEPIFAAPYRHGASHAPVRTIYQFPSETWIENLAVMRNGSILFTVLSSPQLYMVNPFDGSLPVLIHEFPGYLGLLGIAETMPDVFALIAGNFSLNPLESFSGTYAVWEVDFRQSYRAEPRTIHATSPRRRPAVSKIADIPQGAFLNALVSLYPYGEPSVLLSDSALGVVFKLDLLTKTTTTAIDDPLMKKCSPSVLEGINGMKTYGNSPDALELYFINAYCAFLASIPISPGGTATGPSRILGNSTNPKFTFDDLAVDAKGAAYVATGTANSITEISRAGRSVQIAGSLNSTEIAEPTALQFGRTRKDKNVLYITTGGGSGDPINGTVVVGGQVLALDLARLPQK